MDVDPRLIAALSDRYAIEAEIDSGGMATVYRARDLKHERTVAIKVLRPDLAEAIGADRFLREIRTTANLSHPHILPLFDSGEANGFLFYVMPFVEGESLADCLEREGQLPVEDAVEIAREVADALAYAHEKGVIHRDIKPANIMLERGHALLADFGIAQAKAGVEETKLTGSGTSLGTPSYMSPEQIEGNREVDGRSDQYALACVLFEMLAGHPPFTGADIQTVMRQHLAADAPRVTGARASVPTGVAKAIHRALAKGPADRFRSVGEFEKALAGATLPLLARIPMGRARAMIFAAGTVVVLAVAAVIGTRPGSPEPVFREDWAVVLPFVNLTGDASLNATARRAAYQLSTSLGRTGLVQVVPYAMVSDWLRLSAEGVDEEPGLLPQRAIAEDFQAGLLIQGEIYLAGDSLRLETGYMESDRLVEFPRPDPVTVSRDSLDQGVRVVTDRLAGALARHLNRMFRVGETARFHRPAPSLEAWKEFEAAAEAYFQRDYPGWLRHAENAAGLDSSFIGARSTQAIALLNLGRLAEADSVLREISPLRSEMGLGDQAYFDWARATLNGDREGAYQALKRGAPTGPIVHYGWGFESLRFNRPKEASDALLQLDPSSPVMSREPGYWVSLSSALHVLGEHREELREIMKARALYPNDAGVLRSEIRTRVALGQLGAVEELVEEAFRKDAQPVWTALAAGRELRAHGHAEVSRFLAERVLSLLGQRPVETAAAAAQRDTLTMVLYLGERWDAAYEVSAELVGEEPDNPGYLGRLGLLAARRGREAEARRISGELAVMEEAYDFGTTAFSRACIAAVLGDKHMAVELLEEAHERGWEFSIDTHTNQDLELLRGYPPFEAFLRPKG
jgi:serine/threonine-protein kinase